MPMVRARFVTVHLKITQIKMESFFFLPIPFFQISKHICTAVVSIAGAALDLQNIFNMYIGANSRTDLIIAEFRLACPTSKFCFWENPL